MNPTEEIHHKLVEFESLNGQGSLTSEAALALAGRAAELVIEQFQRDQSCLREAITLICRIATDPKNEIARAGITALFPMLIERLNDSFEPAACRLYDRLFAQVIEFCRRLPEGKRLDEGLKHFGLLTEADLLARKTQLPTPDSRLPAPSRVLLLSRVTIGADVAVTSSIIAKLRQAMPEAEFVILGSRKLRELYGGDERIRIHEIAYERGGSLIARLTSWLDVVAAVNEERQGFNKDGVWVIDPDSRLTQLGLLPLVANDHNYFFFESRSYQVRSTAFNRVQSTAFRRQTSDEGDSTVENQPPEGGTPNTIAELAAHWSGELIGNSEPSFPFVALPEEHQELGKRVTNSIRNPQSAIRNLVAVSFGVGGNHSKRVSDEFEQQLIENLLTDSKIILDKGATEEEREQINRIVTAVRSAGKTVIELSEATKHDLLTDLLRQADIVTWDGSIGAFAGLVAASNLYIGYDSAGQHIAAALGVKTLTVFVSVNNTTFADRWRPFGKSIVKVLNVVKIAKH
ncbi:MAG: glycosyltransferase family 9 protein [Acidobacteriota bacterium]|nr:glycosyltransferase family 9 protein [Acidobacteriota bacterium]